MVCVNASLGLIRNHHNILQCHIFNEICDDANQSTILLENWVYLFAIMVPPGYVGPISIWVKKSIDIFFNSKIGPYIKHKVYEKLPYDQLTPTYSSIPNSVGWIGTSIRVNSSQLTIFTGRIETSTQVNSSQLTTLTSQIGTLM